MQPIIWFSLMTGHAELILRMNEGLTEAGCDEAGRGPLAGPVFAAAVILPEDFHHPLLNDSKKMTEKARNILRPIIEKEAVSFAVEAVSAEEIDILNILNASIAGMQRAVMRLAVIPDFLLIDGNRFRPFTYIAALAEERALAESRKPGQGKGMTKTLAGGRKYGKEILAGFDRIPYSCIVKGDGKFAPIAAASVLAKTYRDEFMRKLAAEYPEYGWDRNMGYPTREHLDAIRKYGYSPYHRKSFHPKELNWNLHCGKQTGS